MNETAIVPVSRVPVTIRPAVAGDLAFMDRLQQMHSKAVGFMPTKQLEQKISRGEVLVADDEMRLPIGYCISSDRYFKRDEVGIVYQMNVSPGAQRKLVAASLLKSVFERAPYGCRLFCCWCAQDLEANYFWESMGFIALAFRTGAVGKKGKARTHIFWQRRIREGDTTTPFWYPCKTDGGSLRGDRLVLPIPPDVNWRDAMPILIPDAQLALPEPKAALNANGTTLTPQIVRTRRAKFGSPDADAALAAMVEKAKAEKPKREKIKADPTHVKAARELRDKFLEHRNGARFNERVALPQAKYEVAKALPASPTEAKPVKALTFAEAA